MATAITGVAASPAVAQTGGGPFACLTPTVFVAQQADTQLNALTYATSGSTFTPIGPPVPFSYNAIGFNPEDGFIYGIREDGAVLRIDDSGAVQVVSPVGPLPGANIGAMDDEGHLYIGQSGHSRLYVIDAATGTVSREIQLTDAPRTADLTFVGGQLWSHQPGSQNMVRVNPATGQVHRFPQSAVPPPVAAGAAWTYGNGNLGLSDNGTGSVYQVKITGANTSPSFALVGSPHSGPASGLSDGTSCKGAPVDLSIVKSQHPPVLVGQSATWTLTVTNHGQGTSSGYTVVDEVPPAYTDVSSSTPGCDVNGNTVTCSHGPQPPGEQAVFTITATGASPDVNGNSATVTGNEADPNPFNNSSDVDASVVELIGLCRGTPLSILAQFPATANRPETPCASEDKRMSVFNVRDVPGTSLTGSGVIGRSIGTPRSAEASADVAKVALVAPGVALSATGLHSEALSRVGASCGDVATGGSSYVATLVVNGRTYVVGDQPMTIPLPLGAVHVNQQQVAPTRVVRQVLRGSAVTQRAIFVDLPGNDLDVAIAESRAGAECQVPS